LHSPSGFFFSFSNITQQSTHLSSSNCNYSAVLVNPVVPVHALPPPSYSRHCRRCLLPPLPVATAAHRRRCQLP
jgi:hypothetical protein